MSLGITAVRRALGSGGAEAPLSPAIRALFEVLDLHKSGVRSPDEDELGDPHAGLYPEGPLGVVVDEQDPYLSPVPGVYEPRGVDEGDAVLYREPAPRQHEPRVPGRQSERDPGPQ